MSNITIGPAFEVGGNTVEMTSKGKIQVTNPEGRIKTLSQDEFKKNIINNADKINAGEDFEFKKDHKGLKIAAAAVGTAAVITAAIYHKEIGNYLKDFSFKKLWKDIKGLYNRANDWLFHRTKAPAGYSKEYRNVRKEALKETFKNYDGEAVYQALKEGKTPQELGIQSRKTFIPNEPDAALKAKRTRFNNKAEERAAKRLALRLKLEEKGKILILLQD